MRRRAVLGAVALGWLVACEPMGPGLVDAGGLGLDGEPAEPSPAGTCVPVPPLTTGPTNIPIIVGTGAQRVDGVGEGDDAQEGEGHLDGAFVFRGARALEPALAIRCPGVKVSGGACEAKSALAFEDASGALVEIAVGFALAELPAIEDGAAVHVRYGKGLVVTRDADGALLLALPQVRRQFGSDAFEPGLRVEVGPLVLEPVSGCTVGPDWCNRTFSLRTLRVGMAPPNKAESAAAGDTIFVPHDATKEVATAAGRFRITNHMLFERTPTANGMPACADIWPTYFLVDVVRLEP